jgi:UDP-N-acetylmuramyl pentapeptide phosphotransferase/UDP-N-acetylglucosamine-1-phosphate transferase
MPSALTLLLTAAAAAALSAAIIAATLPTLLRYALARPVARSSHVIPTPQGAGFGVVVATLVIVGLHAVLGPISYGYNVWPCVAAVALLALVGGFDDIKPIPVLPRLALQTIAIGILLAAVPADARIFPDLPVVAERCALLLGSLWFVNLVNFMDGIDWMMVVEIVPVTVALALFGLLGMLSPGPAIAAAALCGAYLGFAPFNRPVAKVFLGDIGSLPTGLLLAWCLFDLAAKGHLVAAMILPLYFIADATLTLLRRLAKREKIWDAHRQHFYQRALDRGLPVVRILKIVFVLNALLALLAWSSVALSWGAAQAAILLVAAALVGFVLNRLARGA